jgi:hypothetical protein
MDFGSIKCVHRIDIEVAAMKFQNLVTKASPAKSTQCSGCERGCMMPVEFINDRENQLNTFIICDKRSVFLHSMARN